MENIYLKASEASIPEDQVDTYCIDRMNQYFEEETNSRKLDPTVWEYLQLDSEIKAMGIAFAAKRKRRKS